MKFSNKILFIPTIVCSFFIFLSHSSNPEDRNTGAPFDGLCSNCHSGGSFDGDVTVTGFPSTILPNTLYNLTLTVTATTGSPSVGGFQLVAVNASNVNSGDLTPANSETGTSFSGSREYIDHRGAKAYSGNSVSWNFSWTSPNGPNGSVITIYYSSNMANGNGSSSGDNIIFASQSGTMMCGGNPLTVSITAKKNVSCFGGMDGSATGAAAGGSTPYNYSWSNGETTSQINNLSFGIYRLTVTDNIGSTASTSVAITQPSQLNHVVQITRNVSCPGGRDGAATTSVSGGTQPYTIIYSSGSPNGLRAGQYTVTVLDANACSASSTFTITEPDTFTVATPTFINPTCPLDSNGAIKIQVSGGNPPYKYKWNTNDTGVNLIKLKTGTYKLTITDSKNCNTLKSYELKSIDSIAPKLKTKEGVAFLDQEHGIAIPQASNYIESLTDNCDLNPVTNLFIDTFRCSHLGKSAYIMQAIDQSGNSIKDTFFITVNDTFKPVINKWPDTILYNCNVIVPSISATDNCSLVEFKKISGPEPGTIFPIGETIMKYQAIDNSGNKTIDSFIVSIQNPIEIRLDSSYFNLCIGDTLYQYVYFNNKNGGPYSILHKTDTLNLIRDTTILFTITRDTEFILNAYEISTCNAYYKDTIIYPGLAIHLDSISILDESALNARDGKLIPHFNAIDSFVVFDASTLERINNTGTDLPAGTYIIKAYRNTCAFEYGTYTIKLITITKHASPLNILVYPIPFSNSLHIENPNNTHLNYQILNFNGKVLEKGIINRTISLETSNFNAGIYLLKIGNEQEQKIVKIMKL